LGTSRLGRRLLQHERDQATEGAALFVGEALEPLVQRPVEGGGHPHRLALKKAEAIDGGVHAAESLTPAT
jgi:hypothetical protein